MSYLLVLTCTRWRVLVTWHLCRMGRMRATRNKLTKQSSIKCFHIISMATIVHRHLYLFICGSGSCTFTPDKITWEIINYTWACSYIYIHSIYTQQSVQCNMFGAMYLAAGNTTNIYTKMAGRMTSHRQGFVSRHTSCQSLHQQLAGASVKCRVNRRTFCPASNF